MSPAKALLLISLFFSSGVWAQSCPDFLQGEYRRLHSTEAIDLCGRFSGKALLVINTASHCGFAPQFEGLEALHQRYGDQGLAVVGFASDDFNQEAATEEEAASVCYENFGVTFTMFAPTRVKGKDANPLFKELAKQTQAPGWNFNKYLVSSDGKIVKHFESDVEPGSEELNKAIEALLN